MSRLIKQKKVLDKIQGKRNKEKNIDYEIWHQRDVVSNGTHQRCFLTKTLSFTGNNLINL